MTKIRVLLVDDSVVVRGLLRSIFAQDDDFEVIGEVGNGAEAVAQVRRERPGLITMDLEMPLMGGVEAIEDRLAEAYRHLGRDDLDLGTDTVALFFQIAHVLIERLQLTRIGEEEGVLLNLRRVKAFRLDGAEL